MDGSGQRFASVVQHNAVRQRNDLLLGCVGAHRHAVQLGHSMAGVREQIGKITVIRQQQQPLAVLVQTPHRVHPNGHVRNQVHYRFAPTLIVRGGDVSPGLIHHIIIFLRLLRHIDLLSVYSEQVFQRVHFIAHCDGPAVQLHAALTDELFCGPA